MKKMILTVMMLMCFVGTGVSQGISPNSGTKKDEAKINELLSRIEQAQGFPNAMNRAIQVFERKTRPVKVAPELKREIVNRFVGVYKSIGAPSQLCVEKFPDTDQYVLCLGKEEDLDELIKSANRRRIIGVVSYYGGSNEAREFFLDVLENANPLYRKEALHQIYFGRINGDEVYNKIQSLVARGLVNKKDVLSSLKGANPKRAVKEIQDVITTTKDPEQFVRTGNLLSEYGDPDLMDVVVERYAHFRRIPPTERPYRYNPTLAFKMDTLKRYIEQKEGERLEKAIEIFDDSGVFGETKLPLIAKKLQSHDPVSRKAAVAFLIRQTGRGSINSEKILPLFRDIYTKEIDPVLKQHLKKYIDKHAHSAKGKAR